jgi:hypothetical protein
MTTIRAAFALLADCSLTAFNARSSVAEVYRPWCVSYPATTAKSCAFTSFEQCMMTAGPGTGGVLLQDLADHDRAVIFTIWRPRLIVVGPRCSRS